MPLLNKLNWNWTNKPSFASFRIISYNTVPYLTRNAARPRTCYNYMSYVCSKFKKSLYFKSRPLRGIKNVHGTHALYTTAFWYASYLEFFYKDDIIWRLFDIRTLYWKISIMHMNVYHHRGSRWCFCVSERNVINSFWFKVLVGFNLMLTENQT